MWPVWLCGMVAGLLAGAPGDGLLLYAPFDGAAEPAVVAGSDKIVAGQLSYEAGRQGLAVRLNGDLRYSTTGNWNPVAGTVAVWVSFRESGAVPAPRYLMCIYGDPQIREAYCHNRFSLSAASGRMSWTVYAEDGAVHGVSAPIADWAAGSWHQVAATWSGLDGTAGKGELRLYLDGRPVGEQRGLTARIGRTSETLEIGRDSDASPDYTDGLLDEFYVYDQPLPAALIARAAARPSGARPMATALPRPVSAAGWASRHLPYRVQVTVPASDRARKQPCVAVPLTFAAAAARLSGRAAALDPTSLGALLNDVAVPWRLDGDRLLLRLPVDLRAGEAVTVQVYFDTVRYDVSEPLQASRAGGRLGAGPTAFDLPDYATEAYGKPWDFKDGGDAGIDQWGNKPEFIVRRFSDGLMHLTVKQDPWFIWGDMWGQVPRSKKPVDIDVERYRLLEIRCRQSVGQARWQLYGRPVGRNSLITHEFTVSGTSWQTIRIDLAKEARWRGHLCAFRIDPTDGVDAQVDIDWVRLLALAEGVVGRVQTAGAPSAVAALVSVVAPPQAVAGADGVVSVAVRDAGGQPVSGQPVRLRLMGHRTASLRPGAAGGYGPTPTELAGVTGRDGSFSVRYHASERVLPAGDRFEATAELTNLPAALGATVVVPGPASQLVFDQTRTIVLPKGNEQARLAAQVADRYGNAVAAAGQRLSLTADDGWTVTPAEGVTNAQGALPVTVQLVPAKRWVGRVQVRGGTGWQGASPAICYTPAKRDWAVTRGANGYFQANGQPWLPLGGFYANWVSEVPATGEAGVKLKTFVETTDAQKTAWLKFLADQGVTAMRFMLRAHRSNGTEPLDIGGKVNPELYAEALRYLDLARPFGIRFLVVLHEDYTKPMYFDANARERFCVPRWDGTDLAALPPYQRRFVRDGRLLDNIEDKYTDPDAMACQDAYAREIVGLLKDNPQIFCYELENEQVAVPPAWIDHQCDVIRAVDPRTPICMSHGGGGLHTGDPYFWRTKTKLDFYTYHLYPTGTTNEQVDYGLTLDVLCRYGRMAGWCFLGESVGDEFSYGADEDTRRRVARDVIWFSLANGNPGCMFWNQRGYEVAEFKQARRISDEVKLGSWKLRAAPLGVRVDHRLTDDYWFRSKEGGQAQQQMSLIARGLLRQGADFDFTWSGAGYAKVLDLTTTAPAADRRPLAPSDGFEATGVAREDGSEGLSYVRNIVGVRKWTDNERQPRTMYLRVPGARPCRLQLGLGTGTWQVTVTDLATGAVRRESLAGGAALDLGTTDHDFAVHWRR